MTKSKILVILGMHRSGTSLTAQWLSEMGLHLGESLLEGGASNQNGHFEDLDFLHFHKSILDRNNLPYYITDKDQIEFLKEDFVQAKKMLVEKSARQQWGWKEPRTCLFLSLWLELFQELNLDPYYLIVYRPVEQVVDSLVRRDIAERKANPNILKQWYHLWKYKKNQKALQQTYLKSWILHQEEMKKIHQKYPNKSTIIQATSLASSQNLIVEKLISTWKFDLQKVEIEQIFDQKQFQTLPEINKYSNQRIQEMHSYFTNNTLS